MIKNKKLFLFTCITLIIVVISTLIFSVAALAASPAASTLEPDSTFVPVMEPTGCWGWGPGKLFLVSSLVTLSIAIIISLIQANKKFKD